MSLRLPARFVRFVCPRYTAFNRCVAVFPGSSDSVDLRIENRDLVAAQDRAPSGPRLDSDLTRAAQIRTIPHLLSLPHLVMGAHLPAGARGAGEARDVQLNPKDSFSPVRFIPRREYSSSR